MLSTDQTPRRGFLARVFAATAALTASGAGVREASAAQASEAWLNEVKGTHRCLFDFPRHSNGWGLVHVLNYLNTYSAAYKAGAGEVGAVGTFYGIGAGIEHRVGVQRRDVGEVRPGEYTGSRTPAGSPTRATCSTGRRRPTAHLLSQAMQISDDRAAGRRACRPPASRACRRWAPSS